MTCNPFERTVRGGVPTGRPTAPAVAVAGHPAGQGAEGAVLDGDGLAQTSPRSTL